MLDCRLLIHLALALLVSPLQAQSLLPLKLQGTLTATPGDSGFAGSLASTDSWLIVGESGSDELAHNAGMVYLFDARTGSLLRKLSAPQPSPEMRFGHSVAAWGDYIAIGTYSKPGTCFLFNARTGTLLRTHTPNPASQMQMDNTEVAVSESLLLIAVTIPVKGRTVFVHDVNTGDLITEITLDTSPLWHNFGMSIALDGELALISNSDEDVRTGAAYLYNARTGQQLLRLEAADKGVNQHFGISLSISGRRALIGAPQAPSQGFQPGAAYVFDLHTGEQICKLNAPHPDTDLGFSWDCSIQGNLALVGALFSNTAQGAAYLFDATTGALLRQLDSPGRDQEAFGVSVHLGHRQALVGALLGEGAAPMSGAAYLFQDLPSSFPLNLVTQTGSPAPGANPATFRTLGHPVLEDSGSLAFPATLSSRKAGVWHSPGGILTRAALMDDLIQHPDLPPQSRTLSTLGTPLLSNAGLLLCASYHPGSDQPALVTPAAAGSVTGLYGPGIATPFPGLSFSRLTDVTRRKDTGDTALLYHLRRRPNGANPLNDTGLLITRANGSPLGESGIRHREGRPAPTSIGIYGQFLGRAAFGQTDRIIFPAYLHTGSHRRPRQALFHDSPSGSQGTIAIQGQAAPDHPDATASLRSFLSESIHDGAATYRATLTGPRITPTSNEGLFTQAGRLLLRKGSAPDPTRPHQTIARILGYWPLAQSTQAIVYVRLRGKDVTQASDGALYHLDATGPTPIFAPLLREGDPLPDSVPTRIRTLQRIDVDTRSGHYVILATLTGPAACNQALFTGHIHSHSPLRQPHLALRKGTAYLTAPGQPHTLRSLSLPTTTDKGGAGAKGHSQVINAQGQIALRVEYDSKVQAIATGIP